MRAAHVTNGFFDRFIFGGRASIQISGLCIRYIFQEINNKVGGIAFFFFKN